MLGVDELDAETGREMEELAKTISKVTSLSGGQSKIAMGKLLNNINSLMLKTQGKKSKMLAFARWFEGAMGARNAYRLLTPGNVIDNTFSGISQILQTAFSTDKKVAKKELRLMLSVISDVAFGGQHVNFVDSEDLSFISHDYKYDSSKGASHNLKAAAAVLPNVLLGIADSAVHSYVMRTTFHHSAVLTRQSALANNLKAKLVVAGKTDAEINKILKEQEGKLREQAVNDVTNAMYDKSAEFSAMRQVISMFKALGNDKPSKAEVAREVSHLMFNNMVKSGVLTTDQTESLKKAADSAAKNALGKKSGNLSSKYNLLASGAQKVQRDFRQSIKKDLSKQNYSGAASKIMFNAVLFKGLFPYISGAANWAAIKLKKTPLGALYAIPYTSKSFRQQVSDAANLTPKELEDIMERNAVYRNNMLMPVSGLVYSALAFMTIMAYFKATGDDDDDLSVLEMYNEGMSKATESNKAKSFSMMWLPPLLNAYNIAAGNFKGDVVDMAANFAGAGMMETPLTKAVKYARTKDKKMAGFASIPGQVFEVGTVWNMPNSWYDAFTAEETDRPSPTNWWKALEDYPLASGFLYGMAGYRLSQDVKGWTYPSNDSYGW